MKRKKFSADWQGFNEIKLDVGNIASTFAIGLSNQLDKDLVKAQRQIVDQYYSSYNPNIYNRQKGLYDILISHGKQKKGKTRYLVSLVVGSDNMDNHYGGQFGKSKFQPTTENIFDLVWNQGVRGLPKQGDSGWQNPAWNNDIYHNIFSPTIKIREYSQNKPTADIAMEHFVMNWDILFEKECDKLEKHIQEIY